MTVRVNKPAVNLREELADLRKPTGIAGEAMLRAETVQEQFQLIGAGRRNWIINGDFSVSQRGAFTTASTYTTGTYYVDRWKGGVSGSFTKQHKLNQTLPNGQITNSFRVTSTGGAYASIQQYVEDYSVFSGQLATLSFWAKTNKSGCTASFYTVANQFDVVTDIVADDQWHYYKATALVPTGGTAMRPEVWTGTGSSSGDYVEIAQVQLELGKVATPFEHARSYGEELALCQRYFYNLKYTATYQPVKAPCWMITTTVMQGEFMHPVTMRTGPTLGNNGVGNFRVNDNLGGDQVCNSIALGVTTENHTLINFGKATANLSVGNCGYINTEVNNDAEFTFDAEL